MKSKFYVIIFAVVITAMFFGCSKQAPKCSDDETATLNSVQRRMSTGMS